MCAGLCRPSVLDVWGVPGVCRECARCVLREHAWVVLRVCGVCAGSVPGVCGRAWVGGVPGVPGGVRAMQGIQRGVCRSVWVCRERACRMWGARGCAVCRVCVCVCRECAGCVPVCWSGVCGLCGLCLSNVPGMCWPCWVGMRIGRLVWGVVGVCRAVPAKRAGCVGCARCVPGVCQMCAARACMGRAAGVRGVCRECAGRVRESMGRGCAGRVPGGVLGALGVCHARHPARRLPERAGVPGARAGCGVRGGVPCAGCVPGVCVCAGCVPVCSSGVCGLCGLCLSNDNVPDVCWESMGRAAGVRGVPCAGCGESARVPGVCRVCGLCGLCLQGI